MIAALEIATEQTTYDGSPRGLSLVVPVYRNEENIVDLLAALTQLHKTLQDDLEVVFVIDGSPDRSGELLLAAQRTLSFQTVIAFHSRNFGSFTAIRSGMSLARGKYIAVMAADLQEPPELVVEFFSLLENDQADVVFGTRTGHQDGFLHDRASAAFWWLYRSLVMPDIPRGGVDMFACSARVRDVVVGLREANSSLLAQVFWVGLRRAFVPYQRRPREFGETGWSMVRRFRYMMDSIFAFTDLPITITLWAGVIGCFVSAAFAVTVLIGHLTGAIEAPGYATLVILIVFFSSLLLTVQGIFGAYIWRTFENTKERPIGIISRAVRKHDATGFHDRFEASGTLMAAPTKRILARFNSSWVRFLIAGATNTAITICIYQILLFFADPELAYLASWLAGLLIVAVAYPAAVFQRSRTNLAQRIAICAVYIAGFVLGLAVLRLALSLNAGRAAILFVVLACVPFNFCLMRLILKGRDVGGGPPLSGVSGQQHDNR